MNERIKELHEQACKLDLEQYPNAIPDGKRILQKFAELIIKEVLAVQEQLIAEGHNAWHVNKPTREHFGVE